jgi:hypothetical protein
LLPNKKVGRFLSTQRDKRRRFVQKKKKKKKKKT